MNTLKKIAILFVFVFIAFALALGQAKRNRTIEAEIIAQEKRSFEAWKNKDRKFFLASAPEWSQNVDPTGVRNREQWAQAVTNPDCTVKSYALDNVQVTPLSAESALLVYRYAHDSVCNGKPEASPVWASTLYVKQGRIWLAAFHQETPAAQ